MQSGSMRGYARNWGRETSVESKMYLKKFYCLLNFPYRAGFPFPLSKHRKLNWNAMEDSKYLLTIYSTLWPYKVIVFYAWNWKWPCIKIILLIKCALVICFILLRWVLHDMLHCCLDCGGGSMKRFRWIVELLPTCKRFCELYNCNGRECQHDRKNKT